jgi:hypothetical protein
MEEAMNRRNVPAAPAALAAANNDGLELADSEAGLAAIHERATREQRALIYGTVLALSQRKPAVAALAAEGLTRSDGKVAEASRRASVSSARRHRSMAAVWSAAGSAKPYTPAASRSAAARDRPPSCSAMAACLLVSTQN